MAARYRAHCRGVNPRLYLSLSLSISLDIPPAGTFRRCTYYLRVDRSFFLLGMHLSSSRDRREKVGRVQFSADRREIKIRPSRSVWRTESTKATTTATTTIACDLLINLNFKTRGLLSNPCHRLPAQGAISVAANYARLMRGERE